MEYFVGSALTIVFILIIRLFIKKQNVTTKTVLHYSQSRTLELVKDIISLTVTKPKTKKTQATIYQNSVSTKIAYVDDRAYWIKDNCFYTAPVIDDEVMLDEAVQVDTMSMNAVQLNQMLFIVEQLREGLGDDNWHPGQQKF